MIKPTQLIVVVEDQTDFSPFAQPPARVGIIVGKNVFEWDFRERLAVKGNINSVLVTDLYFLNEKSNHNLATVSDYWTTRHSIKLEVPIGSGAFTIFAEDTYGHRTTFTGTFK